jgi:hypothetical protein
MEQFPGVRLLVIERRRGPMAAFSVPVLDPDNFFDLPISTPMPLRMTSDLG